MPSGTITPSAPSVRTDFSNGLKAPTRSSYWVCVALRAERFCQLESYSTSCISSLVPEIIASGYFVSSTAYYFAQTASICGTNPVHCWILHCGVRYTGTNTCTSKSHIVQTCDFLQFCLAFFSACQRSDGRKKQNSNLLRFLRKRPTLFRACCGRKHCEGTFALLAYLHSTADPLHGALAKHLHCRSSAIKSDKCLNFSLNLLQMF